MDTAFALPPPAVAAPPEPSSRAAEPTPFPSPRLPEVLQAMGGFALLGLAGGLGSGVVELALRAAPAGLLVPLGTGLLTAPALLVAHQLFRFRATPEVLVGALSGALVQTGRVALALVPVAGFFAATSGLWSVLFGALAVLLGAVAVSSTARRLHAAEPGEFAADGIPRFHLLVLGWQVLAGLVALRLGVSAVQFVLAPLSGGAL